MKSVLLALLMSIPLPISTGDALTAGFGVPALPTPIVDCGNCALNVKNTLPAGTTYTISWGNSTSGSCTEACTEAAPCYADVIIFVNNNSADPWYYPASPSWTGISPNRTDTIIIKGNIACGTESVRVYYEGPGYQYSVVGSMGMECSTCAEGGGG